MNDPWEDIGAKSGPHQETYEEALARCEVLKPDAGMSEQDKAEKLAFELAMSVKHDAYFQGNYLTLAGEQKISRTLARLLNHPEQYEEPE